MSDIVEINSKIISVSIKDNEATASISPMLRPVTLKGTTYKIKTPLAPSTLYVTINDIIDINGSHKPFEIFINSRDVSNLQWVTALTRLISAIFRTNNDSRFVVRELLSTHDVNNGYLKQGKYIPSLVAEIGLILEEHFKKIGIISTEVDSSMIQYVNDKIKESDIDINTVRGEYCSKCGHHSVHHTDGCSICTNCGDSKCSG
jgi:hypothetical protein